MSKTSSNNIERKATIFNIQKYNTFDGPGVRTLVFFKGCPLRCKWCANPEGLERKFQVMYKSDYCVRCGKCAEVCPVGIHKMTDGQAPEHIVCRNIDCIGCRACEEACIPNALSIAGEVRTISELLDIVEEDRTFYTVSGGGITLGGGEVTMQPEAAANLLMACKHRGIHTAIETCGYVKNKNLAKIAEFVDLFLFDIKHMDTDEHFKWTGVHNEMILENLEWLFQNKHNVQIRMPLLKGVNDKPEDIEGVIDFLMPYKDYKNFKGVDLLPYHKMGVNKYGQLDMKYPIEGNPDLGEAELKVIEDRISKYDFPVSVIRH